MKIQDSRFKIQKFLLLVTRYLLLFFLLAICNLQFATASEKWQGVDEAVVEKIAKEQGREARKPFINTDQGDLLLFVFLVAGAAGGFIAGYSWRILITERKFKKNEDEKKAGV